jgi:UDP-N-acetylglucosamine--N-acetylmuramyl-(pentapeptide) pyrophosphoryl-undecaprenol N-acetylglucosamine transferase
MKSADQVKILVVAGGSGGHVLPAFGLCQELQESHTDQVRVVFVVAGSPGLTEMIPSGEEVLFIKADKSPLGLLKLFFKSLLVLVRKQPDIVVGFGGYICVFFLGLAKLFGKKTYLHEQNVVPGRANRFLSRFVDGIAISFSETKEFLKKHAKKTFLTRYPARRSLQKSSSEEALKFFDFTPGRFTVLVMGGSQGASRINEVFLKALQSNENLESLQVIHLCGLKDFGSVSAAYARLSVKSKIFAFLPEMNYAYSVADLVLGRSGAGSIVEIMRFALPSILVPYPYAGAHQLENARLLAQKGASLLLEDAKMTPCLISGLLDIFLDDPIRRKVMSVQASSLRDASSRLTLSELILT